MCTSDGHRVSWSLHCALSVVLYMAELFPMEIMMMSLNQHQVSSIRVRVHVRVYYVYVLYNNDIMLNISINNSI